jgi:hypothetical protein
LSMTELNSFNRLYELCKEFRGSADFVAECADELEFTTEE